MAELMAAPPENLFKLPPELPDETAVLADSLASALQPVLDNFPPDAATVVIYGAGIIGQHVLRGLRTLGCGARLVMVARHREALHRAKSQVAGDPLPVQADVTRAAEVSRVFLAMGRKSNAS